MATISSPWISATRRIRGAVLRYSALEQPYARSRPIVIEELTLNEPGETELLIEMEAASVCHSDLSVVNGSRLRPLPMLLGHEAAGRVLGVGSQVTDIAPGQRVIMTFLPRCGACANCRTNGLLPCSEGTRANTEGTLLSGARHLHSNSETVQHHLGVSGFATHAVVDRRSVVPVDDDVPPEVAAVLGCAVLTGGGALLNNARITAEDTVAVVGLGGVGMAGLLTAVAQGCAQVIAVDNQPEKLELALSLGAAKALTPQDAIDEGIRVSVVLEAVGNARAFETAFGLVAPGGRLVTVGLPSPESTATISPLRITAEAITIMGSYMGAAIPERDIPRFVELWRSGSFPIEKLISDTIRLDQINEAMDRLADASAMRQVVLFHKGEAK
ncbi:zinc-binding dehydrogenase [Arthrobacter sp. EPSL27]|uniref:zinc-binding dehydrogenase n=1 Tax=Arthrobacter sp. EPSL27 TaxID=1745378 RepID=UPI000A6FB57B|nr:zinc-binding dehydrogenase [Arthrobacter sp. EPSL27]